MNTNQPGDQDDRERQAARAVLGLKAELWKAQNRSALDAYDEHVERDGVFSDGLRSF